MNDQQLYERLDILRSKIKNQVKEMEGKAPTVCTDASLVELVHLRPLKKEDLLAVPGIGKTFVEKYGDAFVKEIINGTEKAIVHTEIMNDNTRKTIRELEKKLVNINRNNKLLYMPKLPDKLGFDLYDQNQSVNPYDIIFSDNARVICNLSIDNIETNNDNSNLDNTNIEINKKQENSKQDNSIKRINKDKQFQAEKMKYKRLTSLIREVNRSYRESGQYDLYIGFPFVIGRLPGENFDVRAPLALFPVQIIKEPTFIAIMPDPDKDAIFNNSLILAYYKFNGINKPLPNNVIEDFNKHNFMDLLLTFYKEQGLNITSSDIQFTNFKEYMAADFPSFNEGTLKIDWNMILGKYPICESSIQKDFDDILENGTINDLLSQLLQNVDDVDYYSDKYSGLDKIEEMENQLSISEKNLAYIGELNSSQENVISAIKNKDALVVQGPPGTGKSQTITSLISDFVNNGKNVLMVSEKKAALDVVYSRLGSLNSYAILIDDSNNKNGFYNQIEKILNSKSVLEPDVNRINNLNDQIDIDITKLNKIGRALYEANDFGIEVYKLYLMNDRLDITKVEDAKQIGVFQKSVQSPVYRMKYEELFNIWERLKQEDFVNSVSKYIQITESAPWFLMLKDNLSEFEIASFMHGTAEIAQASEDWKSKNFVVKLFTKNKLMKTIHSFCSHYFNVVDKPLIQGLIENSTKFGEKIYQYQDYIMSKPVFFTLNEGEKAYLNSALNYEKENNEKESNVKDYKDKACKEKESNAKENNENKSNGNEIKMTFAESNDALFNYMIGVYLQKFEAEHRDIMHNMSDFRNIITELNQLYKRKKELVEQKLKAVLSKNIIHITESKRQGEIARVVDMKVKWSIHKFIQKFSFELFKGIRIWLLTPEVASEILPLEAGLFDLVIFDEASQLYIERGVPAVVRGKKIVVAGDSKQLRPSSLGSGKIEFGEEDNEDYESNAALEEESLLDLARFRYVPPVLLNYHYRSKYEELIAFSNYAFYKGRLCVSPNAAPPEKPPIEVIKIDDGLWESRQNRSEAKRVVELLKQFSKERKDNDTVGIITFNSNQRELILDLIDEESNVDQDFGLFIKTEMNRKENGEDIGLFVKNIENVQGDERDTIIFSIGYAKNTEGKLIRNFGWLNQKGGENRLNVAISRARKKIFIVTSFEPHELQVEDSANDGPRFLKKYLEYCFAISKGDKAVAKQVLLSFGDTNSNQDNIRFDSDFENMVYDALVEQGFQVDTQVGIGGYSIDLSIKKDDKYILGIECDGKLYHSSKSARERDYHRQKYLESRGWKIHRIWSPNWWRNPGGEIEKIVNLVNTL